MSKENYIEEIRPHDSAYKHVSGYAEYTDDINEPKNTIYGAIGLSKKAHAIIKKIYLKHLKFQKDLMMIFHLFVVLLILKLIIIKFKRHILHMVVWQL